MEQVLFFFARVGWNITQMRLFHRTATILRYSSQNNKMHHKTSLTASRKWFLFFLWTSAVKWSGVGFGSLLSSSRVSNIPVALPSIRSTKQRKNVFLFNNSTTGWHLYNNYSRTRIAIRTLNSVTTHSNGREQHWYRRNGFQNSFWDLGVGIGLCDKVISLFGY